MLGATVRVGGASISAISQATETMWEWASESLKGRFIAGKKQIVPAATLNFSSRMSSEQLRLKDMSQFEWLRPVSSPYRALLEGYRCDYNLVCFCRWWFQIHLDKKGYLTFSLMSSRYFRGCLKPNKAHLFVFLLLFSVKWYHLLFCNSYPECLVAGQRGVIRRCDTMDIKRQVAENGERAHTRNSNVSTFAPSPFLNARCAVPDATVSGRCFPPLSWFFFLFFFAALSCSRAYTQLCFSVWELGVAAWYRAREPQCTTVCWLLL